MGTRPESRCSTRNFTNVGLIEVPNIIFKVLNEAAQMEPLPPLDTNTVQELIVPHIEFNSKRPMADLRKEKIHLNSLTKSALMRPKNPPNKELQELRMLHTEFSSTADVRKENYPSNEFVRRRSNYRPFRPDPTKCSCCRPQKNVWCLMCGFITKGNVKVTCPQHPKNMNMDEIIVCPNPKCRAPNHLMEGDI